MAIIRKKKEKINPAELLQMIGALAGGFTLKNYRDKLVISTRPTKRKKKLKPTPAQDARRHLMKEAVSFAKRINADPVRKAAWKKRVKGYSNVYQTAISYYLKNGPEKSMRLP